jgi:multidrug transporter EmrE-like cation transporter
MTKAQAAFCVALTIGLTVYGQLVVKWQVLQAGDFPAALGDRVEFMFRLVANPWILSVFAAAAIAALAWMAAMTRLELSVAYPFVAITFALVLVLSGVFFDEAITTAKTFGVGLIILGIVVASR